jgi:hypothetical protein
MATCSMGGLGETLDYPSSEVLPQNEEISVNCASVHWYAECSREQQRNPNEMAP